MMFPTAPEKIRAIANKYNLKVLEVWVKKGKRWLLFARQSVKN